MWTGVIMLLASLLDKAAVTLFGDTVEQVGIVLGSLIILIIAVVFWRQRRARRQRERLPQLGAP